MMIDSPNKPLFALATLGLFVYLFFIGLGDALLPLATAFGLAYLVFPLVQGLEERGYNRHKVVIGIFSVLSLLLVLLAVLMVPRLIQDFKELIVELPSSISKSLAKLENLLGEQGLQVDLSREHITFLLQENSKNISAGLLKGFGTGLKSILGIMNLFLIPLFFFYLIDDYERITKNIEALVPKNYKEKVSSYLEIGNSVLSGYIRGQLMVALCLSVIYSLGLSLVGLKFGFLIGILTGLISIIPYAGFAIGLIIALSVSLAHYSGLGEIFGIVAVFGFAQILEGFIITPKLVGNKLGLSAFATMLALIVGGNLLGLFGMLAAIPIAAILKFVISDLVREYKKIEART